jgi:hypothetical protein
MPKDARPYITLHNGMPEHPKIEDLSDAGFRTLVTLWCWCSRNETDGWVTPNVWTKRTTPAVRRELLASLVEDHGDRFYMHDYLDHQRSAEEIADLREKRSKAGAKGGKRSASAKANAQASASANGKQDASKVQAYSETESSNEDVPPRVDVESLCQRLADRIEENGSPRPSITQRWRDECRRMLDRDKRDVTRTERLIDWCQASSFWRANVLSMPKFREQYDKMRLQAIDEWERGKSTISPDGDLDVDAILGPERFEPPAAPDDLPVGSPQWKAWHLEQRDAWVADRERRARETLARRAS